VSCLKATVQALGLQKFTLRFGTIGNIARPIRIIVIIL